MTPEAIVALWTLLSQGGPGVMLFAGLVGLWRGNPIVLRRELDAALKALEETEKRAVRAEEARDAWTDRAFTLLSTAEQLKTVATVTGPGRP